MLIKKKRVPKEERRSFDYDCRINITQKSNKKKKKLSPPPTSINYGTNQQLIRSLTKEFVSKDTYYYYYHSTNVTKKEDKMKSTNFMKAFDGRGTYNFLFLA